MSNKDVKQDALDNLADVLTEDILNTPDDELLREAEEDYGDPLALANKFDQILERAEKQVFGTAHSAASPQIRWVKGIFGLASRVSEFLSSLTPRTIAWSATAAAVAILVQAAVITAVLVKEHGASSGPSLATATHPPGDAFGPPRKQRLSDEEIAALAADITQPSVGLGPSDEEIAAVVAGGRQLMVAGDIPNARLVLLQAAQAGDATATLELGATYDPIELEKLAVRVALPDIAMARKWYQKAKDLGSTEAADRLERLSRSDGRAR